MRIPINLAREPFRRDRPMLVASAVTGLLLLATFFLVLNIAITERRTERQTRSELNKVEQQRFKIRQEQTRLDAQLRRPDNAIVLDRNVMINDMIRRKAISWTRIFADLEKVMPPSVRIASIRPQVNSKDQLSLDMTVEADAPESVIAFVAKLESSDVFGSTEVPTFTPPNQNDPYYHYRLSVNYAQKL